MICILMACSSTSMGWYSHMKHSITVHMHICTYCCTLKLDVITSLTRAVRISIGGPKCDPGRYWKL